MPTRYANATWEGGLKSGKGSLELQSKVVSTFPYDYLSRFEEGPQSNPEELLGAAHAGCFAMFLSSLLEKNETPATKLVAKSKVTVKPTDKFQELAKTAKQKCPISKSLAAVAEMTLNAVLE